MSQNGQTNNNRLHSFIKKTMKRIKNKIFSGISFVVHYTIPKSKDFVIRKSAEALIKQRDLEEIYDKESILKRLTTVHIETRTRCNSLCTFCAANTKDEIREDRSMSMETYKKIIDGLAEFDYQRRVSPYCNNEPLMDSNIYDFIAYTRKKLPNAYIEIKTNGMLLNEKKMEQLFDSGIDSLNINDYQISEKSSKRIHQVYEQFKETYPGKINFGQQHYDSSRGKINRAGSNPSMESTPEPIPHFCYRPFEMAIFTVDGTMGACSNDFYLRNNIGNIYNNTFIELFTGERINDLRKDLLNYDRSNFEACKKCDYFGLTNDYEFSSFYKYLLPFYYSK